ncbi:MAG: PIN domain-containing protein [Candidatus Aenigmarchaeota archaeon]|nr:PIN domain-containing protein [Candidatus Aenigmarchaeota archaeon]
MVNYFFDTYALIEITKNNPNYLKFIGEDIATTKFNLVELVYIILSELDGASAKGAFQRFRDAEVDVSDEILLTAAAFRLKNKKKSLSYADCIGYAFALGNNLKFLTGDDAFAGMKNVEFVK